jgi:tRNA A-37 threonylcarbamoyl transferase component Bud32
MEKTVSLREWKLLQAASHDFVAPRIVRIKVMTEALPTTLQDCIDANKDTACFAAPIGVQIARLHRLRILHGNLCAANIAVHPQTHAVKLLNFEHGYTFDEVTEDVLLHLNERLEPDEPFVTLADVVRFELTFYKRTLSS